MNRRKFMGAGLAALAAGLTAGGKAAMAFSLFGKKDGEEDFPFTLSDEEWRERLSPEAYRVLRGHGTEAAFSSPLNDEKRKGVFHCKGCEWPLYSSEAKYESGTGWPSFWQPLNDGAVGASTDYKLVLPRTEIHCANCGGHLGHVFDDGPPPTGRRYCMNGVAMGFDPAA